MTAEIFAQFFMSALPYRPMRTNVVRPRPNRALAAFMPEEHTNSFSCKPSRRAYGVNEDAPLVSPTSLVLLSVEMSYI